MKQVNALKSGSEFSYLWHMSLGCFLVAGLTGFLYRMGMLGWIPEGLTLGNIRHAHSHLMFFGWAVPLPLYILLNQIIKKSDSKIAGINWMKNSITAGLVFGILAFPSFLLFGYRPVTVGSASLPFSVILSGLVMLSWYGFMYGYKNSRKHLKEDDSWLWFDGALIMLLVSSLGAWGVAVVQAINPSSHLFMKGLTHFFLAAFTEGWMVLILLAILLLKLPDKMRDTAVSEHIALGCIAIGAPMTFPYGISESLLSPLLLGVARFGGALAATGLLLALYSLISTRRWRRTLWIWPIALLACKGLMQLTSSFLPSAFWLSDHGIRIFYLHVLLLGAFTVTAAGWLYSQANISGRYYSMVVLSILITLFTLLMPTGLWPSALSGIWIFETLAAAALLPVISMSLLWYKVSGAIEV